MNKPTILRVALPIPLRRPFDFTLPPGLQAPQIGSRVKVPLGRRRLVGVVIEVGDASDVPPDRLRHIVHTLDEEPIYSPRYLDWLIWIADYYHHPIGDVVHTALPTLLRQGHPITPPLPCHYKLTPLGVSAASSLNRAPVQQSIRQAMLTTTTLPESVLARHGQSWQRAIRSMIAKGLVEKTPAPEVAPEITGTERHLNVQQTLACEAISASLGTYTGFLLYGVTGSGKTEVYLDAARQAIERGLQVLLLVPEIGLTPQLVKRCQDSVGGRLVVFHSDLSDGERHRAWAATRNGSASIILGTRSAVFVPLKNPGLIIIDEEHDLSFKQQDGLRYHARDIAVYRARQDRIPIVLGSATPSFESMANVAHGRYKMLRLSERAMGATMPEIGFIDLRKTPQKEGLSRVLEEAISRTLAGNQQSLIFINRRGYAPVLFCTSCGWLGTCSRCDTRMIYHKTDNKVRCHHCGSEHTAPEICPQCHNATVLPLGEGTQRLEAHLRQTFPSASILRIDRDSTRRKGELERKLEQATRGEVDILIGTQLLAKGHHFPGVTLVGVIDADQGMYSVDFRASEHLFQQIIQVAGRAGRAEDPGQVLIQTLYPDHPHFSWLRTHDYTNFVDKALIERKQAQHPPYSHFVLFRAESTQPGTGLSFLRHCKMIALRLAHERNDAVEVMDPVPSPMEKRAGRYRAQLLISSRGRPALHRVLDQIVASVENHELARKVRWSIDVDPMEMY